MRVTLPRLSPWTKTTVATTAILASALTLVAIVRFGSIPTALAYLSGERLLVAKSSKSFGAVEAGTQLEIPFEVMNHSDRTVTIVGARSSCDCTIASNLPSTIRPGGVGTVTVRIKTGRWRGNFSSTVTLYADDARRRSLALTIRGYVRRQTSAPERGRLAEGT